MATGTVDLITETTGKRIANALEGSIEKLDGTAATYKKVMREWFLNNGAQRFVDKEDYDSLTELCDKWYMLTNDGWCGYTEFYQPDVSAVTYGTKGGDNADLTCTPSTDTVANQDDYAGLPLFACVDCNWTVDETTLRPIITAIDGITSNFKRKDTSVYVGVLQMAGWLFRKEDSDTYTIGYAANGNIPYPNVEPLPQAVNPDDNTVRSWMVHGKYMNGGAPGSAMTCCAGVIPHSWFSHNLIHIASKINGSQYSGSTTTDDTFLKLMMMIKYGSLTLDGILQGCCNANYQYPAQVSETGVTRILISTSHSLEVGMGVLLGNYVSSADRGSLYDVTGQAGAIITKIETVTITDEETSTDTDYAAVYVDVDDTFDTVANGAATSGTTYISTYNWPTGTTDTVLGNDGSPVSNTSGKYPAKLQGIEYMNGSYEIFADVILNLYQDTDETYVYEPYIVKNSTNQSTAISSNYEATGLVVEQPVSSDAWLYIKKLGYSNGVMFPVEVGGSSSTYTRDAFYMVHNATGIRAWLARGTLSAGVGLAGLSCLGGNDGLTAPVWHSASRLSPNGNRGEWAA